MKTLRWLGLAMLTLALSVGFVACSSDDDEKDAIYDEITKGDYLEVTIDGKTYRGAVPSFYPELEVDYGLVCSQNTAVDNFEKFEANHVLFHYDDPSRLLECKPGNYDVVRYDLYGYDAPDYKNFDLALTYSTSYTDNFESMSGTNKVTSIKKSKDGVVVEGTFDAEMSNAYYADREDGVRTIRMKGKYRMTVLSYYSEEDF